MLTKRSQSALKSTRELAIGICTLYVGSISASPLVTIQKDPSTFLLQLILGIGSFSLSVKIDQYIKS